MRRSVLPVVCLIALTGLIAACDDDALFGPGFSCDVTNPIRDFVLAPSTASLITRIPAGEADTVQLRALATGRFGELRGDLPFEFSSSDNAIATVDSLGIVHAVQPGTVTIKASVCGKSASSVVTVVRAVVTVQTVAEASSVVAGDSVLVTARAISQAGTRLPEVKFTFSVSPSGSATLKQTSDSTVYVFTITAGNLTVTATGEGVNASTVISVLPRVFLPNGVAGTVNGGLDAGRLFTCGLISLGRAYCWGLSSQGQLGAPTDSVCYESDVTEIVVEDSIVSASRPCSLLPERTEPSDTAVIGGPGFVFSSISAGDSTVCAIASNGRAFCWGYGPDGEIGNGTAASSPRPTLVTGALTFTAISVGGNHACALATGGVAYCWGRDSVGQLGDARRINSTTPIPVVLANAGPASFSSISAGGFHTCALNSTGGAFCWGANESGQLGNGNAPIAADVPVAVPGGLSFTAISAGFRHSCGITAGGAAWCWGSNSSGQVGNGLVGGAAVTPVPVGGGLTFSRISAGTLHTCGLTTSGSIYCWGNNDALQLGQGPFSGGPAGASGLPLQVRQGELPSGVSFASVTAGESHTCGVGSDGAAYCWGSNIFGALGNTLQAAFRGLPQRVATPR